jgi:hypothetical protein
MDPGRQRGRRAPSANSATQQLSQTNNQSSALLHALRCTGTSQANRLTPQPLAQAPSRTLNAPHITYLLEGSWELGSLAVWVVQPVWQSIGPGPGGLQSGFSTPKYVRRDFCPKKKRVRGLPAPPVAPRPWVP